MDPGPVLGPDRSWTGVGKACRRQGLPGRLAGFVSLLLDWEQDHTKGIVSNLQLAALGSYNDP